MRFWFDTEFIEDGRTIDLLAIGMVSEDGRVYYAEPLETNRARAGDWVKTNVLPHLRGPLVPRKQIADEIREFVGDAPEIWAYYADYDWVALCQLYGTMMELPFSWPMFCRDLKQLAGDTRLPDQNTVAHNALNDALWAREAWDFLTLKSVPSVEQTQDRGASSKKPSPPQTC